MLRTDLPQFDISENIVIGTDITEEILAFYKQPFRLKAGIFILCLEGEIHASIKMTDCYIKKNDFVSLSDNKEKSDCVSSLFHRNF